MKINFKQFIRHRGGTTKVKARSIEEWARVHWTIILTLASVLLFLSFLYHGALFRKIGSGNVFENSRSEVLTDNTLNLEELRGTAKFIQGRQALWEVLKQAPILVQDISQ